MKGFLKWAGIALGGLLLAAAALAAHTWYAKPLAINWFYTRVFAQFAWENPEFLTQMRLLEPLGLRGHNARLADGSSAETERLAAWWQAQQDTLRRYGRDGRAGQDLLSYDILDAFLAAQVRLAPYRYHDFPVNQLFGVQSELPNMMTQVQQVNDVKDAEHYLARLDLYPWKMDGVAENLRVRAAKGIVPPRFVVEKVGEQVAAIIATPPEQHALVTTFRERLDKAQVQDAHARAYLVDRAVIAVGARVIPAYRTLAKAIDELKPLARENHGAWSLPDGERYYQALVEMHTTTRMPAAELHDLGLAEVARIGREMDAILAAEGFREPTRAARLKALSKAPTQLYADDEAGRAQVLADYQAHIDEITAGLPRWFATLPRAKVEVKRVPAIAEKTAPFAYYNAAPFDGSRPAVFYANLRQVSEIPKFGMRTLAYHEAVPGHHLQISIAQELKGLPLFRSVIPFTAYSEGWALYAEQLAWEGGYQQRPLDNLGRLQAEMFRAVRLVVDTGIHARKWTREQAIDYMVAETGMPEIEVVAEVERYFVMPGQALAYKVGMMKFLALRDKAKAALGARFDLKDFHRAVLENGAMPLAVLERVVDEYIATSR